MVTANSGTTTISVRLKNTVTSIMSIIVPSGPVNLGAGGPGTGFSATLGAVVVIDNRSGNHSWTATVTASNFTTCAGTPPEIISNINGSYWSGPATASTGGGTFIPGQLAAANAVTLAAPRTAFTHQAGNANSTTWNPTLIVAIPAQAVAGTYTGTVTHSVA